MKYSEYQFANRLWVDRFVASAGLFNTVLRIFAFSWAPWIIGLGIAISNDLAEEYLQTLIFYLGAIGIFLTLSTLVYASMAQYTMFDRLFDCFEVPENEKRQHVLATLERHSNFCQQFRAIAITGAAGLALALGSFIYWDTILPIVSFLEIRLPKFSAFDRHGWYREETRFVGFWIVVFFIPFISAPLGTSTSIIMRLPTLLLRIARETPRFPPSLIKFHFSAVATFYTIVSIFWVFGVLIFAYLVSPNADWLSGAFVFILFLLGAINFFLPQYAYVKVVSSAGDRFIDLISKRLEKESLLDIIDIAATSRPTEPCHLEAREILLAVQLLRSSDWVYPLHQTYIVVGAYIISVVGSAINWSYIVPSTDTCWIC